MPRSIDYEYRRTGKPTTHFREWLVLDRPDVKVLLLDEYDGAEVQVDGVAVLESGAPIVWCVFPDRWYDIGRFHLRNGTITGWYTNLCRPVRIDGDHWVGSDLFLDLWQPVEGEPRWLDEEELAHAVHTRLIDGATHQRIRNERSIIELQLREDAWPPPVVQDIDLAQARELRDTL